MGLLCLSIGYTDVILYIKYPLLSFIRYQHHYKDKYVQSQKPTILQASTSISSSSNLREFAKTFIDHADTPLLNTQQLYSKVIDIAGDNISSSSNLRDTYLYLLKRELSAETLAQLITTASQRIGSSSNLGEVLAACIGHEAFSSELADTMRNAIGGIGSSSVREGLLDKLLTELF